MSDIQKARDVLAKWRQHAAARQWAVADRNGFHLVDDVPDYGGYLADVEDGGVARLIVGTAGNPDLLDAITDLLSSADRIGELPGGMLIRARTKRIAAAIIAADERMSA